MHMPPSALPFRTVRFHSCRYPGKQFKCRESAETIYGRVVELSKDASGTAVAVRVKCLNGRVFVARIRGTTAFLPLKLFDGEVRGTRQSMPFLRPMCL